MPQKCNNFKFDTAALECELFPMTTTTRLSKFRQPNGIELRDVVDVTNEFQQFGEKGNVVEETASYTETSDYETPERARYNHKLYSFEVNRRPGNQTPLPLRDTSSALNGTF